MPIWSGVVMKSVRPTEKNVIQSIPLFEYSRYRFVLSSRNRNQLGGGPLEKPPTPSLYWALGVVAFVHLYARINHVAAAIPELVPISNVIIAPVDELRRIIPVNQVSTIAANGSIQNVAV